MPYIRKGKTLTTEKTKEIILSWASAEPLNATHIKTKLFKEHQEKISTWTINKWCEEANIVLVKRTHQGNIKREATFVKMIKDGFSLKEATKAANIGPASAHGYLIKNNIKHLTRDRAQAAVDKRLSEEDRKKECHQTTFALDMIRQRKNTLFRPQMVLFTKSQ